MMFPSFFFFPSIPLFTFCCQFRNFGMFGGFAEVLNIDVFFVFFPKTFCWGARVEVPATGDRGNGFFFPTGGPYFVGGDCTSSSSSSSLSSLPSSSFFSSCSSFSSSTPSSPSSSSFLQLHLMLILLQLIPLRIHLILRPHLILLRIDIYILCLCLALAFLRLLNEPSMSRIRIKNDKWLKSFILTSQPMGV